MKNVRKVGVWALVLSLLVLWGAACSSGELSVGEDRAPAVGDQSGRDDSPAPGEQDVDGDSGGAMAPLDTDRKIITNTDIRMESPDVQRALRDLGALAQELGGYIQSEYLTESRGSYYGELVVRVPAGEVEVFTRAVEDQGTIRETKVAIDDVTAEYTDTASRLANARVQEERLLAMFEAAESIDELLYVQTELDRLQERIEVFEGQIRLWDNLVALATVSLDVYSEAAVIEPGSEVPRYIPADTVWERFTAGVRTSLVEFVNGASLAVIWLGSHLVQVLFVLVVLAVLLLVLRRWRRGRGGGEAGGARVGAGGARADEQVESAQAGSIRVDDEPVDKSQVGEESGDDTHA